MSDIKLGNILWDDEQGRLMLIDFDLSTFKRETGHCVYAGTEGFESPEMRMIENMEGVIWSKLSYSREFLL